MKKSEKPFDLMAAMKEGQCFTRDGRKVILVCVLCDGSAYPVQGVLLEEGGSIMQQVNWTMEGQYLMREPLHAADLVNGEDEDEG